MTWVDNGQGAWVWREDEYGDAYGPKPLHPPASAGGQNPGAAPGAPGAPPPEYSGPPVAAQPGFIPRTPDEQADWEAGPAFQARLDGRDPNNGAQLNEGQRAQQERNRTSVRLDQTLDQDTDWLGTGGNYIQPQQAATEQGINQGADQRGVRADQLSQQALDATQRDTAASDQSRGQQQAVIDRQLALLDQILGFNPEVDAQNQTDRALSASLSQARSARGGAGAVSAQEFAAQANAPQIYSDAYDKALQTQQHRFDSAGGILQATGAGATAQRQSDENRSQLDIQNGLEATSQIKDIFGIDASLSSQEQQQLGQIRVAFAQQYNEWAKLDAAEQIARIQALVSQYATSSQLVGVMEQINAQVKMGKKNVGDYALALLGAGAQVGSAFAGAPTSSTPKPTGATA